LSFASSCAVVQPLHCAQISHHPPVSAYQLQGPGWALSGWSQPAVVPVVKFYGIKTVAKGARHINFEDGSTVQMTMPHFAIKGGAAGCAVV
jgi:hypothetical protein